MWAEFRSKWGESSFRLTWQQRREPCLWGWKFFFATSAMAPMPSPIARPAKGNGFAHAQEMSQGATSLKPGEPLASEVDQPADPGDGHLSLSRSVAELKHQISAWHTGKKSLHTPSEVATVSGQGVTTCLYCFGSSFLAFSADLGGSAAELSWCPENRRLGQSPGARRAPSLPARLHGLWLTSPPLKQAAIVENLGAGSAGTPWSSALLNMSCKVNSRFLWIELGWIYFWIILNR